MSQTNPTDMLKLYRLHSNVEQNLQAEMLRKMPIRDAVELIFYMTIHGSMAIQHLHARLFPLEAQPQQEPEVPQKN